MKIQVMVHNCEGEINVYVEFGNKDIRLQLYDYVIDRWYEGEEYIDGQKWTSAPPIPADNLTAVTQYFEAYSDMEQLTIKVYEASLVATEIIPPDDVKIAAEAAEGDE